MEDGSQSTQSTQSNTFNEEDNFIRRNLQMYQNLLRRNSLDLETQETQCHSADFIGDLIEEVKNYRCIWDNTSRGFKELPKKQEAWKRIAEKFKIDGLIIPLELGIFLDTWPDPAKSAQTEWNKLKENYRKCLKRREKATRSGAGAKSLPTCQYFRELSFITGTVSNRPTTSNVPDIFTPPVSPFENQAQLQSTEPDLSSFSQTGFSTESFPNTESDVYNSNTSSNIASSSITLPLPSFTNSESLVAPTQSPVTSGASSITTSTRKQKQSKDLDAMLMQSIQKDLETPTRIPPPPPEKDPETLFCLSLVQEFKELSPRKKRKAKVMIMQVFCDLNEDE